MLASKKVKMERVLPTLEQLAELLGIIIAIVVNIFKRMNRSSVQYWIGHEKELASVLKNALLSKDFKSVDKKVADWVKFYHEVFGLELDPTEIELPVERDDFNWIVLVAKGLARNAVFDLCTKRFDRKTWRYYDDLNSAVTENDRQPTETYVIRVRDGIEADECHQNKSANTATKAGIQGMTNLERMLLELWYHWKMNDHLDQKSLTICSGSRYADGRVPSAHWLGGRFDVGHVDPGHARDSWRVRETVSLPAQA